MHFLIAIAAVVAGMLGLQAKTVAWYHFNEGANGTFAAGGQPVVQNAADPGNLTGYPYRQKGCMDFGTAAGDYLPFYTNAFSSLTWYDPVTGECDADGRSFYFNTAGGDCSGNGATVLVSDNEKLHCEHITVECMAKIALRGKTSLKNQTHLLTMRNADQASTPNQTTNLKAWGLFINAAGTLTLAIQTPNSDGTAADSSKSFTISTSNSDVSMVDGNWHHIAFTYDGATVRLYVDHVQKNSKEWSYPIAYGTPSKNRLCIGTCDAASYASYWQGFIDEVRISDEALPPEQFLQVRDVAGLKATDADTAIYLPFNNRDFSIYNSATSDVASQISMNLSTISAGIFPRSDTGASAIVSENLHSGIFAADTIANIGCWTFSSNLTYVGKARHIFIDDFSANGGNHLISSSNFTAECWIKVPTTPTTTPRILSENSGSKGAPTLDILLNSSALYFKLASSAALDDYETNKTSQISYAETSVPIDNIVGDAWHHIALVVDRTRRMAKCYVDGRLVGSHDNFVLASSVSTVNEGHSKLKIGDGYGGNNANGLLNMSIDEFRITRRALAPQEFLMTGAAVDSAALEPTRAWIGFEGDLSVEPSEGAIPAGSSTASTVTMDYSSNVPGLPGGALLDGTGKVLRESNTSSMYFSGAFGSGDTSPDTASQRLFFERNILLEKDMKSMTVEFFMKGTKNEAKAWSTILRMYGNATGSDNSPFRRLWSVGYENAAGSIYFIKDING